MESDLDPLVVPGATGADPEAISGPDVGGAAYCWMSFVCHNREGRLSGSQCSASFPQQMFLFFLVSTICRCVRTVPPRRLGALPDQLYSSTQKQGGMELECLDTSVFPEKLLQQQSISAISCTLSTFLLPVSVTIKSLKWGLFHSNPLFYLKALQQRRLVKLICSLGCSQMVLWYRFTLSY